MPFPVLIQHMVSNVMGSVIVTRTAVMYPQVVGLPPQVILLYEYPMHFGKKIINGMPFIIREQRILKGGGCYANSVHFFLQRQV